MCPWASKCLTGCYLSSPERFRFPRKPILVYRCGLTVSQFLVWGGAGENGLTGGWAGASLGAQEESPELQQGTMGYSSLPGLTLGLPESSHYCGLGHLLATTHACGSVGSRLTSAGMGYASQGRAQRPGAKPAFALAMWGAAPGPLTRRPAL